MMRQIIKTQHMHKKLTIHTLRNVLFFLNLFAIFFESIVMPNIEKTLAIILIIVSIKLSPPIYLFRLIITN